jgi:hypothetical protein
LPAIAEGSNGPFGDAGGLYFGLAGVAGFNGTSDPGVVEVGGLSGVTGSLAVDVAPPVGGFGTTTGAPGSSTGACGPGTDPLGSPATGVSAGFANCNLGSRNP